MTVSILDKARSLLSRTKGAAKTGIDKSGDAAAQRPVGLYESRANPVQDKAKDILDKTDE